MNTRTKSNTKLQISFFSESALVVLISIVTLLLQLISFATTWNGSRIYLEGVFPYASWLFAIAIQATAYFFSNSLRTGIRPMKVIALCTALCCSTYYSYIGIYHSVNSPATYLQENYVRISHELTQMYDEELERNLTAVREAVGTASALVTARCTSLDTERQQYAACREALENLELSYSSRLRAPRLANFETYEEYAAAYQAYITSISQGSNTENAAGREGILSAFGFSSMDELSRLEAETNASLRALGAALHTDGTDGIEEIASDILLLLTPLSAQINTAIDDTYAGLHPDTETSDKLNRLFQAASLCGYRGKSPAEINTILNLCADTTATDFLPDYASLVAALPEGNVTDSNLMDLKSAMDSALLSAQIKLHSLLPDNVQLSYTDERYQITDLYLVPIQALRNPDTRTTAFFCLAVAALIDLLSLLFAISLREKKPLWKKHFLLWGNLEEYAPFIYASLPAGSKHGDALSAFLGNFRPSPLTESDGYMLQADMSSLRDYNALAALLCQLNLARIIPADFSDTSSEILLLKARFVFWANAVINAERTGTTTNAFRIEEYI